MLPEEAKALGDLAGHAAGGLATHVRHWHEGIAERVFNSIGPAAIPVRTVHDGIAGAAYAGAERVAGGLVRAVGRAVSDAGDPAGPSIHHVLQGRLAIGALNGAFGDRLAGTGNPLAVPMTVRRRQRDVPLTGPALAGAFPDATDRLAVFLHGLCETDDSWKRGSDRWPPYGARLRAELGYTPVYLRYNSGLHISENGRLLVRLLDELVRGWPVELNELTLVGHSMGGLVARSACHYAALEPGVGDPWTAKVRHVISLGAPHTGAPLERLAHRAAVALGRLPETRAMTDAFKLRSAGIQDLFHGYLVDEDWAAAEDAPARFLRELGREIPFLSNANHYFVAATVTRDADAPVGRVVGDLLVLRSSAWAHARRGEQLRFPVDSYRHYGGANHFDLLSHPAIADQLVMWLGRRALEAGEAA